MIQFDDILDTDNVAELLDQQQLDRIGGDIVKGYHDDESSRSDWMERNEAWMKLATQVVEQKNFPWPNAANVKYPLVTTAAIQFAARAYPALIPGVRVVRGRVIGKDLDGSKTEKALRIAQHMSYQVLEQMEDWEEDMDRLTILLPIIGCAFKKTYYSPVLGRSISELVHPKDLVVNYYAKNLEEAIRKTHLLEFTTNAIHERIASGIFLDVDFKDESGSETKDNTASDEMQGISSGSSEDTPRLGLEQHCFLDLDGDGYKEPYIVTVDLDTASVYRIVKRFDEEGIEQNEGGIVRIAPVEYFTKFSFIPNPDGGFYDLGFGVLLGPMNETANTLINQLLDAGTQSTLQAGFIARGIRIRNGNTRFSPGEWKTVDSTGDDLRKGIVPLPTREPSTVLFNLLSLVINSGERLASVTDLNMGENPGQNQKATTTMAVLEQGLKVFTAIYKRLHRSLKKEYRKLYRLNKLYLDPQEYFTILDTGQEQGEVIYQADYHGDDTDIVPASDPNIVTEQQKLAKAQGLLELLPLGLNVAEVVKRVLEAQDQPNADALLQPNPPSQPDPEVVLKQQQLQFDIAVGSKELEIKERESLNKGKLDNANALLAVARAETEAVRSTVEQLSLKLQHIEAANNREEMKRDRDERAVSGMEE